MRVSLGRFARHDSGTMAVEYGLVCAFVVLITIGAMRIFGTALLEAFPKLADFPTIK